MLKAFYIDISYQISPDMATIALRSLAENSNSVIAKHSIN